MAGLGFDDTFPKIIPAKTHAVIDYIHAATNFTFAAIFAHRGHKRAATAAAVLGGSVLFNALMTDYELGVFRVWSFKVHGYQDYGVAAASALFPTLLGFAGDSEATFFHIQGGAETLTAGVSDYNDNSGAQHTHGSHDSYDESCAA